MAIDKCWPCGWVISDSCPVPPVVVDDLWIDSDGAFVTDNGTEDNIYHLN